MWIYKGKEISSHEDLYPECTDIVYHIKYESGKEYFGKKTVRSMRRLKPTKKQLAIRKNFVRKEIKESPFINYKGSSKYCKDEVPISKEILYQCADKRSATYLEAGLLFCNDVLFNDNYLNENILGKFYINVVDGVIKEKEGNEKSIDNV